MAIWRFLLLWVLVIRELMGCVYSDACVQSLGTLYATCMLFWGGIAVPDPTACCEDQHHTHRHVLHQIKCSDVMMNCAF